MKYYRVSDIIGMQPDELIKLNKAEIQSLYRQVKFLAEARDRAADKSKDVKVPVRLYAGKRSVDPSLNYKEASRGRLIHEIRGFQSYLSTKSSTKSGTLELRQDVINRIEAYSGYKIPESDYEQFWEFYNALKDSIPESTVGGRYELWRKIGEVMDSGNYNSYEEFKESFMSKEFPTVGDEDDYDDDFFLLPSFTRKGNK